MNNILRKTVSAIGSATQAAATGIVAVAQASAEYREAVNEFRPQAAEIIEAIAREERRAELFKVAPDLTKAIAESLHAHETKATKS